MKGPEGKVDVAVQVQLRTWHFLDGCRSPWVIQGNAVCDVNPQGEVSLLQKSMAPRKGTASEEADLQRGTLSSLPREVG